MRNILIIAFVFSLVPFVWALDTYQTQSVSVEEIAVPSYAVGLTPSNYLVSPPIQYAHCVVLSNSVMYRADETDPTVSAGFLLTANTQFDVTGGDIGDIKFIRAAATSAAYVSCDYRR